MASQQTLSAAFRVYFQPSDGDDGQPAYVLALSNEVEVVPCDGLGNVSDVSAIEGTTWTFYAGSTALDVSGYSYTVRAVGCSVSYDADGTTGAITVGAMTDDTATVSVIVTYNDTTYTRTYTLTKNYAGLSYHIVASPTVLKADSDGHLTDNFLYYAVRVYDNGTVTTYTDLTTSGEAYTKYGLYLYYAYAGASSRTGLAGDGTFTLGTGIIANAYANGGLTLYLYQGGDYSTGTLVDQEDIEVVKDGADGNDGDTGDTGEPAYTLDLDNECEAVACDSDGKVTGTIQGSHFYFYVGSEEATFGSGCTYTHEDTGCTATVSHSGTEGTIVIDNLTDDTGTVTVTVTYGSSVSRTKTYTVTKVYAGADGSSPTVYSLCVSPAAIKNRTTTELTVSILCTTGSSVSEATFASGFWGSGYYCYWRLVSGDDYGSYTAITSGTASLVTSSSEDTAFLACDSVEVSLWKGTYSEGTRVDVETIPCVDDGEQGNNGNDGTSINVAGEVDAYCPDWSTFSAYIDANNPANVVIACGEYGIMGSAATATGPYLYTFESETSYTYAAATVGNCYTVKDGDYAGHIICAVESGWVDLGALTAETVEYIELKDGSYVSSSYASSVTAVISEVDQTDGSLTFGLAYDLYVCLAHVVGTTTSYATSATVTAEIMTASGTSTVTLTALTAAPYVYVYTGTETGVEEDPIPSKIVVTAEYEGETYTYSIPVTVGVKSYLSSQEDLYACIYMSDGSTSTLLQTVAAISATVTARTNLLTGLGNGNGWTNRGGVSTNVLCDANGNVMGLCYTSDERPDYLYSPQIYLACGQTYTLSIYHSGTGRISLRYATEQGETAYALFSDGEYIGLDWSSTGETLTFRDGSGTDYDGATYTRYSATFVAPVTGWYVFRDATSSYYWLVCPQLEVGDTVNAWNMGDTTTEGAITVTANEITSSVASTLEGYVTSSQLTQTATEITATVESDYSSAGLSITDDTIVLYAEKVYVENDGEQAALFEDGKISADYIDAEEVVTDYFEAENAVIEDLTIEGNITYKTTIINKGNYADYFHDVTPYGLSTSYPCLDVCSLSGPVVLDAPLQNVIGNNICLPFVYGSSGNVSSYVRGVTTYNAAISRSMTWEDFRRCIGKEIILTNHTGSQVNVYCYGYVDEDGTFMAYSSGFLTINNGYSASFLLRYLSCGFVWEVRHATSFIGIEQDKDLSWDLPDGAVAYQDYQWSGSSRVSATGYMATGLLTVPEGTQRVQLEVLSDGDNLLAIDGVYIGTTTSLGTTLLDSTTEDCTVKRYDDSYAYAVSFDVDESAAHYLAVNVAVYDGTSGTPGDLVAVSDTDVDIDNLKILFY